MAAICMLNALWFKPDGGAQRYAEYGEAVMPLLRGVGAEMLLPMLPVVQTLEGGFDPDLILLVRYPSKDAFNAMWQTDAYSKIAHLRTEAITKAVLTRCALEPEDAAPIDFQSGSVLFEGLSFTPGGRPAYDEYLRQIGPLIEAQQGRLLSPRLLPERSMAEDFTPDLVLLSHFPSMEQLSAVAATDEYAKAAVLRRKAVDHAATVVCQPR
jgi:uncharacterized protein (DUF1330 family)